MWRDQYKCDGCDATAHYSTTIGCYRLDDGTVIPRADQPAWCFDCHDPRAAERLPEQDQLVALVQSLEDGRDDQARDSVKQLSQGELCRLERLQTFRAMVTWRRMRLSPPRCLQCGSTNLPLLAPGIEDTLASFEHPGCGGAFKVTDTWHGVQVQYQVLDAEGHQCSRDT